MSLTKPDYAVIDILKGYGAAEPIAKLVAGGITYAPIQTPETQWVYIAGRMRGIKEFNFPAFDKLRDAFVARNFNVVSPADIDRNAGGADKVDPDLWTYIIRDTFALRLIAHFKGGIAMMPGWGFSTGASAEFGLARWGQLRLLTGDFGRVYNPGSELRMMAEDLPTDTLVYKMRAAIADQFTQPGAQ